MPALTPDSLAEFQERFFSFGDAVLRRIQVEYLRDGSRRMSVELSAQDEEAHEGWSNVIFTIEKIRELLFREGKSTCQVLTEGLNIQWIDDQIWCAFSPHYSEQEAIEDYRRSDFYVVGSEVSWQLVPYRVGE